MNKINRKKKGFTIVELVIVIAVIAILAAVLIPTFSNLVAKANMSADISTVKTLNTYLEIEEAETGEKSQNMSQVVEFLHKEHGYDLKNFKLRTSRNDLLWNQETNRFIIKSGDEVVFAADEIADINLWKVVNEIPSTENQRYNMYIRKGYSGNLTINVVVGVDTGKNTQIEKINYVNTETLGASKTITIRTNSVNTNVMINAEKDTVNHFGSVGKVDVEKINMNGYNENGSAAYVKLTEGKVVAKDGGKIAVVFANNTDQNKVAVIEEGTGVIDAGYTTLEIVDTTNQARTGGIELAYSVDGTTPYTPTVIEEIAVEVIDDAAAEEIAEANKNGANYVARIGAKGYTNFNDAWSAAKNKTLVLLVDTNLNALQISGSYTIDLGGKVLNLKGHANAGTTGGAIYIDGGGNWTHGNLTIKNGTLNMPGTNFSTYGIYNYGTLTMENVTVNSACSTVIYVNGQAWGSAGTTTLDNVIINSTNNSGTAFAAYSLKNWAGTISPTVSINNTTIDSAHYGIMVYACSASVSNTTITVPASQDGLWIMRSAMASGVTNTLNISGNVVVNGGSNYSSVHAQDGNTIVVTAGTYNFDPTSYVDTTAYDIAEDNGTYTVTAK